MRTLLAVSPHLDDAIFSAGATLWAAAQGGWRVVVATVFTGNVPAPTGFALACQLDKGLGPEVNYMALRREEDRAACAVIGAEARHLPLLEAPHRGYEDAAALFGPIREDDGIGETVAKQVSGLIEELYPELILGPLGIGGHVDHLIVRDALVAASAHRCMLWEDWPYLDKVGAGDRRQARVEHVSPEGRSVKLKACLAYRSQLGFQFGGADGLDRALAKQRTEYYHQARRGETQAFARGATRSSQRPSGPAPQARAW